eukprot:2185221-Rhodomonas_salina.1
MVAVGARRASRPAFCPRTRHVSLRPHSANRNRAEHSTVWGRREGRLGREGGDRRGEGAGEG